MRLVDARAVDAVLCFKWDRFIREPLDLEYLIPCSRSQGSRRPARTTGQNRDAAG